MLFNSFIPQLLLNKSPMPIISQSTAEKLHSREKYGTIYSQSLRSQLHYRIQQTLSGSISSV